MQMRRLAGAFAMALIAVSTASADEAAPSSAKSVAARVDGLPISVSSLERELKRSLAGRPVQPEALPRTRAAVLRHLVDRLLGLRFLQERGLAASEQDVDLELARFESRLQNSGQSLEEYLKETGLTSEEFRLMAKWRLSWRRYLEAQLTDANLRKFFEKRRRQFDGTRLRVAQIFWKAAPDGNPRAFANALAAAEDARADIVAGKLSFGEAAARYSESPSGKEGGDIGLITRDEPMPEGFSKAAFSLKQGEISQPVTTSLGVHLIRVTDSQPGEKTWPQPRPAVKKAAREFLFAWLADQQRPHSKIEHTGAAPYFDPSSGELVAP